MAVSVHIIEEIEIVSTNFANGHQENKIFDLGK
jgi:hypothetical protein